MCLLIPSPRHSLPFSPLSQRKGMLTASCTCLNSFYVYKIQIQALDHTPHILFAGLFCFVLFFLPLITLWTSWTKLTNRGRIYSFKRLHKSPVYKSTHSIVLLMENEVVFLFVCQYKQCCNKYQYTSPFIPELHYYWPKSHLYCKVRA